MQQQVDEIVKVYTEKYFPVCEKNKVRILWEPYAGAPTIATGPVGWEALFKAFARALRFACSRDRRLQRQLPSTKGLL